MIKVGTQMPERTAWRFPTKRTTACWILPMSNRRCEWSRNVNHECDGRNSFVASGLRAHIPRQPGAMYGVGQLA